MFARHLRILASQQQPRSAKPYRWRRSNGSAVSEGGDGGEAVTAVGGGDGAGQATGRRRRRRHDGLGRLPRRLLAPVRGPDLGDARGRRERRRAATGTFFGATRLLFGDRERRLGAAGAGAAASSGAVQRVFALYWRCASTGVARDVHVADPRVLCGLRGRRRRQRCERVLAHAGAARAGAMCAAARLRTGGGGERCAGRFP